MRLILRAMRFFNQIRWGLAARFTWVYLTVGILLLGLGTFLVQPSGFVAFESLMPFMILLSFPAGAVAFTVTFPLLDISPGIDFFLLWVVTFLAGYIQWFHVLPKLRSRDMITLSLNQPVCTPTIAVTETHAFKEPSQPRRKIRERNQSRVLHYDAAGRTPLERAILFTQQKRSTRSR